MKFYIQASSPVPTGSAPADAVTLGDAIEATFPLHTEFAILFWGHRCISLCYKYDLSWIILDVVKMLNALVDGAEGMHLVQFDSNTFHARWSLWWRGSALQISAEWESVVGASEVDLDSVIEVEKDQFVFEWREVLSRLLDGLAKAGFRDSQVQGMRELRQLCLRIPTSGVLYRSPSSEQS